MKRIMEETKVQNVKAIHYSASVRSGEGNEKLRLERGSVLPSILSSLTGSYERRKQTKLKKGSKKQLNGKMLWRRR